MDLEYVGTPLSHLRNAPRMPTPERGWRLPLQGSEHSPPHIRSYDQRLARRYAVIQAYPSRCLYARATAELFYTSHLFYTGLTAGTIDRPSGSAYYSLISGLGGPMISSLRGLELSQFIGILLGAGWF